MGCVWKETVWVAAKTGKTGAFLRTPVFPFRLLNVMHAKFDSIVASRASRGLDAFSNDFRYSRKQSKTLSGKHPRTPFTQI